MACVFVSGASRGLGKALVAAFRSRGHNVFAGMRSPHDGADVLLNVREIPGCEAAVHEVVERAGKIDILVNNAGVHLAGPVTGLDQDAFKETLDVNLLGVWRLTRAAVPHMRPGGTIVMISSLSGLLGLPGDGAYAASKFALEGLSQSLAAEVAPLGIRVLVFEPGRVATGFAGTTSGTTPEQAAGIIVDATMNPATPFRTPVGADAEACFRQLGVDRGPALEAVVKATTGADWRSHHAGGEPGSGGGGA